MRLATRITSIVNIKLGSRGQRAIDLHAKGVGVSLISPGFVETPLTAQNRFKMPALITPQEAARQMLRGWARGAFEVHFPRRFTLGMKLLQLLPYRAYFATLRRLPSA